MINKLRLDNVDSKDIPKGIEVLEPAHVSRYLITSHLIKQITGGNSKSEILDVGGKKGLLRDFGVTTKIIDIEESDEANYIQGDALNMPFADNQFEAVVSCDVLEHIPGDDRDKFILEMIRVAKSYVIVAAPFDQPRVAGAEQAANDFYKKLSGRDHRWLIEHIDNVLPSQNATESLLKKHGYDFYKFNHLSIDTWNKTTKVHFMEAAYSDVAEVKNIATDCYEEYYRSLCTSDFSDDGYRTFYVISKNGPFSLELPDKNRHNKALADYQRYIDIKIMDIVSAFAKNRQKTHKAHQKSLKVLNHEIELLRSQLDEARTALEAVQNSRSYALAKKISKVKRITR